MLRVPKVLWAHLGPGGSHQNSLGLRKGNEMAQLLDPWIKDAKGAKGPFPG